MRDSLDQESWYYVLEVRQTERVFPGGAGVSRPNTAVPTWTGQGRKPHRERLVEGSAPPQTVADIAKAVPEQEWETLTVAEGAQGERRYQFFRQRVWECRDDLPGRECWLLLRRNLDGSNPKYCLSNAHPTTPMLKMGQVGASRWQNRKLYEGNEFEMEKSEAGLVEYEVRSWVGWYHHMTMALLAGAFLLQMQQEWGGKDAPDHTTTGEQDSARATAQKRVEQGATDCLAA